MTDAGEMRRALITGATFGIGRALACAFAESGYLVFGCGRTPEALDSLAAQPCGPGRIRAVRCDVTSEADVRRMLGTIAAEAGGLDVLINNAGHYGPVGPIEETPVDEWWEALRANLFSVFLVTRLALPSMLSAGAGKIINMSGGGAAAPLPRYSAYASSKAAVVRFTETIADELKPRGIQVNAMAPGFVATRIHDATLAAGDRAGAFYAKTVESLKRGQDAGLLDRICELALFLASPASDGVTGRLISAQFDDPRELARLFAERPASARATLRRIDDFQFFEGQP